MPYDFDYQAGGNTIAEFHASNAFFRGIRGHVGSATYAGVSSLRVMGSCVQPALNTIRNNIAAKIILRVNRIENAPFCINPVGCSFNFIT